MPRKYQRKTLRGSWSADDLNKAIRFILSKEMGVNEASRNFGISSRTLRRYILSGQSKVPLGRKSKERKEQEREDKTKTEIDITRHKIKKNVSYSSSSASSDDNEDRELSNENSQTNRCFECKDYYETQSIEDWIQCSSCLWWLHESCTMYNSKCKRCGRIAEMETIKKKNRM